MKYNADYFINKFKKIPASKWITEVYRKGDKRCVLGWCGASVKRPDTSKTIALGELFGDFQCSIQSINDNPYLAEFPQKNTKSPHHRGPQMDQKK